MIRKSVSVMLGVLLYASGAMAAPPHILVATPTAWYFDEQRFVDAEALAERLKQSHGNHLRVVTCVETGQARIMQTLGLVQQGGFAKVTMDSAYRGEHCNR
ncbi:hypothetical protein QQM79_14375 [Marinobacteraceae bacterium S3BR75-40.1]